MKSKSAGGRKKETGGGEGDSKEREDREVERYEVRSRVETEETGEELVTKGRRRPDSDRERAALERRTSKRYGKKDPTGGESREK